MGIAYSAEVATILHLTQRSVGELPLCNVSNTSNYWLPETNSIAKPDPWRFFRTFSQKRNRSHVSPFKNTTIHNVLATAGALFNRIRTCAFLIYKMVMVEFVLILVPWGSCENSSKRIRGETRSHPVKFYRVESICLPLFLFTIQQSLFMISVDATRHLPAALRFSFPDGKCRLDTCCQLTLSKFSGRIFSAEHCEKRGRRSLTSALTSDNDLDLHAHSLKLKFFHWLAVCDLGTRGANNRQHYSLPSPPISEPKPQDIKHISDWILIADIFNFFFFFFLPPTLSPPPPPAAFEDDAIAVPVSAAAASCCRYVLISVMISGDKHLIRVCATQSQRAFLTNPAAPPVQITFELYNCVKEKGVTIEQSSPMQKEQ